MEWRKKLKLLFDKKKIGGDLSDELRFHLENEIELNVARGMPSDEARRQALIAFGGVQQAREEVAQQLKPRLLQDTLQDLRYAVRTMRKSPGFAAIGVSILAIGIGANSAIFSAVNSILFARWPVPHQEQLVMVKELNLAGTGWLVSVPNFEDYRQQQSTFQELSLWMNKSVNLTGQERPERLIGGFVSANFFDLMGVKAAVGRTFLPGEDQPGAAPTAVLSYGAWQSRFGADPHMLGRKLILNNETYTVIGILPRGYVLPLSSEDVFVTAQHDADYELNRKIRSFLILGRLKPGTTPGLAAGDLNIIAKRLIRDYPLENAGIHVELEGLPELATFRVRTPLLVLLGAVALVLLIVCANIANLLLARGADRQREIAVRAALGAARFRLARQFLCESLLLSALGGSAGIFLAQLLLRLLEKIAPVNVAIGETAVLDMRVLAFTALLSIISALLFGAAPAFQFCRVDPGPSLSSGSRAAGQPTRGWLRSGFVVVQVAMSLVLVVSAGLLIKSFRALLTDPGFVPNRLLTMEYRLPPTRYRTSEAQLNFHRQMLSRVQQVPGVISAALIQALPFSGNWGESNFRLPGQATDQTNGINAFNNAVTPEYFSTIDIPLFQGRFFTVHDDQTGPAVAIINRRFAEKFFPNVNPVGQQLVLSDSEPLNLAAERGSTKRMQIVGVVGDAKQRNVREEFEPQVYFTYAQVTGTFGTLVIRTAGEPMNLSEAVRQAVWSIDKDQPVWKIRSMDSLIEHDTAPDRFAMLLMTALSGLALLLSALGTYGMLSNVVSQRTRELGVRMALGAPRGNVLNMVLLQGLKLLAFGSLLGLAGAMICSRFIRSLLYGVKAEDLSAFAVALVLMIALGLLASYLPARRATRVDPLTALRNE